MKPTRMLTPYSEEDARPVARIMGDSSAAARALADLERRRALGERVSLYLGTDQAIYVGPVLPPWESD